MSTIFSQQILCRKLFLIISVGNSNNSYGLRLGHLWSRKIGYAWLLYRGSIILAVNKRKEHVLVLLLHVIQLWWICLSFLFLMFTSQVNMWCFPRAKSQGIILVQRTIKYNYFFFIIVFYDRFWLVVYYYYMNHNFSLSFMNTCDKAYAIIII